MNDATRAVKRATQPATMRLPVAFEYPVAGILGRIAISLLLMAPGIVLSFFASGMLWLVAGFFLLVGAYPLAGNLLALTVADRRKILLDDEAVEIRYGFSRRRFRFVDYSDFGVTWLGPRKVLAAAPVARASARHAPAHVTIYNRPALITPMPLLGSGAPATLAEWQSMLNALRQAAIAASGAGGELNRRARE